MVITLEKLLLSCKSSVHIKLTSSYPFRFIRFWSQQF